VQTSDTFFYFDGTNVVGSHTSREISELYHAKVINEQTQICTANDHVWKPLSDFPHLMAEQAKATRLVTAN